MNQLTYAILLEDRSGYRETGLLKDFTKWAAGKPYSEKMVFAGSLLQVLMDEEVAATATHFQPPLNYKTLNDSTLKVYCKPTWIHPLPTRQKDLLLAVNTNIDRAKTYRNVEWVDSLQEGSKVMVKVPNVGYPARSTILYIGKISADGGILFGVEILVSVCLMCIVVPVLKPGQVMFCPSH